MILHDGGNSIRITLAREVPPFPRSFWEIAEARMLAADAPDRTMDFIAWWNDQAVKRELYRAAVSAENRAIVRRLLNKHEYGTLRGLAMMVLNNLAEPLERGYRHPMRYLASQIPQAQALLDRWEKQDG